MFCMTTLLLERRALDLDYAAQEAVEPERLRWSSLYSDGTCGWGEVRGLISLVGVLEEFTILTLHRDDSVDPLQRFFQCTGGGSGVDGRLLAEIGSENDVAVVSPWDAGWGRKVPITAAEPWVCGGSFAYTRAFWARHPFADVQIGEDTDFVLNNPGRVLAFPDAPWFIARVHHGNTAAKNTGGAHWVPRDPAPLLARIAANGGGW